MTPGSDPLARRTFLKGLVVLPALAGLLSARAAADASKAPKSAMKYQDTPSGDMQCSKCHFFVPAADAKSSASCQIVDGDISPNGYCIAFSKA
ncbi:MAG TPA: high-potential iron-sulfur protein [Candidatus Cybelea sp.]|nr:high-potential iron-sulfur protein [Candidatus Cybelea sp.]